MKKLLLNAAATAGLALAMISPAAAQTAAQATNPQANYLVVDLSRVLRESAALKSAQPTLETKRKAVEAKIKGYQDQFQRDAEALQKQAQSGVAAPDVLEAKQRELQQKAQKADQEINTMRTDLARTENYVAEQILNGSRPVIDALIKERGATLVLNREAVVFAAPALDITGDVIARMEKSLPTVATNPPAAQQAAAPAAQKPAAPAPAKK